MPHTKLQVYQLPAFSGHAVRYNSVSIRFYPWDPELSWYPGDWHSCQHQVDRLSHSAQLALCSTGNWASHYLAVQNWWPLRNLEVSGRLINCRPSNGGSQITGELQTYQIDRPHLRSTLSSTRYRTSLGCYTQFLHLNTSKNTAVTSVSATSDP